MYIYVIMHNIYVYIYIYVIMGAQTAGHKPRGRKQSSFIYDAFRHVLLEIRIELVTSFWRTRARQPILRRTDDNNNNNHHHNNNNANMYDNNNNNNDNIYIYIYIRIYIYTHI